MFSVIVLIPFYSASGRIEIVLPPLDPRSIEYNRITGRKRTSDSSSEEQSQFIEMIVLLKTSTVIDRIGLLQRAAREDPDRSWIYIHRIESGGQDIGVSHHIDSRVRYL